MSYINKNKHKMELLTIDNFNQKKIIQERLESYNFKTENSKDINIKLLTYAINNIKRYQVIQKLVDILKSSIDLAHKIENGIFEFALVHVTIKNLEYNCIVAVYNDKVNDILLNLDETSYLNNKTLKQSILSGIIDPYYVAFLSASQLHPERWQDILNKKKFREDKENNMAFTDLYKCKKCGKRKCITELQPGYTDEGTIKFIICLECNFTFTK